jgi:hypothetical protein
MPWQPSLPVTSHDCLQCTSMATVVVCFLAPYAASFCALSPLRRQAKLLSLKKIKKMVATVGRDCYFMAVADRRPCPTLIRPSRQVLPPWRLPFFCAYLSSLWRLLLLAAERVRRSLRRRHILSPHVRFLDETLGVARYDATELSLNARPSACGRFANNPQDPAP